MAQATSINQNKETKNFKTNQPINEGANPQVLTKKTKNKMRKLYSLVLIAAGLLIGTNSWAATYEVGDFTELQYAFANYASGSTFKLTASIEMPQDKVIWIGTAGINDAPKSFTLDLNGNDITKATGGKNSYMFVITHGELLVTSASAAQIGLTGATGTNNGSAIFYVCGSYKPCTNFSHLLIDENVTLDLATGCLGTAIAVDVVYNKSGVAYSASGNTLNYFTAVLPSSYGYAYGAQVDVKGDINSLGGTTGAQKAYGIKSNGNLESPLSAKVPVSAASTMDASYFSSYDANAHKADVAYVPYIHVYSTSKITTPATSTRSAAIYASGYAKWLIEGECKGNIGVSVSSGDIDLNGATIASTATTYTPATGDGGVTGSGSAIVVNSRDGYAGNIDVTVSDNTKISATSGYAIEEKVTTDDNNNKVEQIVVESAAITGGDKGAIVVTDGTVENTTIVSATVTGTIQVQTGSNEPTTPTDAQLAELIPGSSHSGSTAGQVVITPDYTKVVTLNAYGLATYSATENRKIKDTELKAYTAEYESLEANLLLHEITSGIIPANTGVILYSAEPTAAGKVFTLEATSSSTTLGTNHLQPADAWTSAMENAYILHDNLLYLYTGTTFKANKAFLQLPANTPAPARISMRFAETEETQAVENVAPEAVKAVKFVGNDGKLYIRRGEAVYTVQGQLVK